jgi:hypothetical protein
MRGTTDSRAIMSRALLGRGCLAVAVLLAFLGFFLPSHDYAGLGDPVLERIVSEDARDAAALLAVMSVVLAGAAVVVLRSRGFVVVSVLVLVVGLIHLVRIAPYY